MIAHGTGLFCEMEAPRRRSRVFITLTIVGLALLAATIWRGWPVWPLIGLVLSATVTMWIADREREVANWPRSFSALVGAAVGGLLALLVAGLDTGLEPAARSLAMAAILPTLVVAPLVATRTGFAGACARGCAGMLVTAGLLALARPAAGTTPVFGRELGTTVAFTGLVLLGLVPLVMAIAVPRLSFVPTTLLALGLALLAVVGSPAMLQVWGERDLVQGEAYRQAGATKVDLQDPFAIGADHGRLVLLVQQADLIRIGDHISTLLVRGDRSVDLCGKLYLPYAANERGDPEPTGELVASRWIRLVQKGTELKPLTTEPEVLIAESVHHGARTMTWPGAWGLVIGLLTAAAIIGRRRCPAIVAIGLATALAVCFLDLWR